MGTNLWHLDLLSPVPTLVFMFLTFVRKPHCEKESLLLHVLTHLPTLTREVTSAHLQGLCFFIPRSLFPPCADMQGSPPRLASAFVCVWVHIKAFCWFLSPESRVHFLTPSVQFHWWFSSFFPSAFVWFTSRLCNVPSALPTLNL